jgi:hypothetical protein
MDMGRFLIETHLRTGDRSKSWRELTMSVRVGSSSSSAATASKVLRAQG